MYANFVHKDIAATSFDIHPMYQLAGMNDPGCELKSTKKEFTLEVKYDGTDHMLVPLLGLNVKPPVTLKLKAGSGPIYISGQYCLEAMSDIEDDDMEDDIDKSPIFPSQKRSSVHPKSQAMVSMEQKYFDSADDFMTQDKLKNEDSPKVVPEATGDHTATSQVLSDGESSAVDSVTSSPGHLYSCTQR
uniref:nucleophosmin-like n=1 Tax=Myxine glutinosa TaxID=7769 RepID=UPI00358FD827